MTKPLMMYTSKESHYSNAKNASFAGMGKEMFDILKRMQEGV